MMNMTFASDGFRIGYGLIALWMWIITGLFSKEYFKQEQEHLKRYAVFTVLTFIATEGVMFSGDLMTTFLFFEILSLTSFVWVIHEETAEAIRAAKTYFFIAIIGGLVLFMGMALMYRETGTLSYEELNWGIAGSNNPGVILGAGICILLGFGAKAGMFPLHIWLPKSHPVAPSPASALLSGILTKVGIFGILMTGVKGFAEQGELSHTFGLIILIAATITMALGAVLALFSVDLKRVLACSSMSQIGFILVGIGDRIFLSALSGTGEPRVGHLADEAVELAMNGTVLHMVNHSLIKLVLFMVAGVFVMKIHKLNLNDIRGYGRKKPLLIMPFALGALGIGGFPGFNGYISKTLLHEGLVISGEAFLEAGAAGDAMLLRVIEWIFLISGGLTLAYMLKLFVCIFLEKNPDSQGVFDRDKLVMTGLSAVAIMAAAIILPLLGQPVIVGKIASFMVGGDVFNHFHSFSVTNLTGSGISIGIGIAVYLLLVRTVFMKKKAEKDTAKAYVNLWPEKLDLEDMIYRPLLLNILPGIGGKAAAIFANNTITAPLARALFTIGKGIANFLSVSTDGLVIILRRTLLKEKAHVDSEAHHGRLYAMIKKIEYVASPITENFSFALMMTAIGMAAVLLAILLATL